jgi:protein-S-isoprenylcysteine O-methyltransferase Ste14
MTDNVVLHRDQDGADVRRGVVRWIVKSIIYAVVFGLALFLTSRRLDWTMGWVYLGVYVLNQVLLVLILPSELLAERSKPQEGTKKWDIWLAVLGAILLPLVLYIVAGLDVGAGAALPPWLQGAALVVMVLGIALTDWAMWANRFFSGTVRIQEDREHAVVSAGPYGVVRHPGYVGAVLHHLCAPLMLGSPWALVPGGLGALVFVVRTALEDRTLHKELAGYDEYARATRYRLLPGVW